MKGEGTRDVVLLADTFNSWFEPENSESLLAVVLNAAGVPRSYRSGTWTEKAVLWSNVSGNGYDRLGENRSQAHD